MKHIVAKGACALIAVALAFPGYAQAPKGEAPGQAQKGAALTKSDRNFITKAMEAGNTEVTLGKLAQEKATDEELKKFGQRMVEDHSKAGEELKAIAQKLGYKPPKGKEGKKKEDVITMFKGLSDDEFDMAYAKNQMMAHEEAVKMFRRQAQQGGAEELKQLAAKSLPVLEEHLKMAKSLPPMKKAMEEKKKKK